MVIAEIMHCLSREGVSSHLLCLQIVILSLRYLSTRDGFQEFFFFVFFLAMSMSVTFIIAIEAGAMHYSDNNTCITCSKTDEWIVDRLWIVSLKQSMIHVFISFFLTFSSEIDPVVIATTTTNNSVFIIIFISKSSYTAD